MSNYYIQFERLKYWAEKGLSQNIQRTPDGPFLSAGATHFRSLWTRDFIWSIKGLLATGHTDVVQNHLERLMTFVHPSSALIPRVLKTFPTIFRVACVALIKGAPQVCGRLPLTGPFLAEYRGEHGTVAADGNVLTVLGCLWLYEYTNDITWLKKHEDTIVTIFSFYRGRMRDGLVTQGKYEDWQDSITRDGATFYLNLLVAVAAKKMRAHIPKADLSWLDGIDERIEETFGDVETGLYFSWAQHPNVSLDGNLLAIDLGWLDTGHTAQLYANLKKHSLWSRATIPGSLTTPDYPNRKKSVITKIAGLRHYHDRAVWIWLGALAAEVAWKMHDHDEAVRILTEIERIAERDHGVGEIYTTNLEPYHSFIYHSEFPFSWSSAQILETLHVIEKMKASEDNLA